jgi:uncharacterized protein (DUF433 family)
MDRGEIQTPAGMEVPAERKEVAMAAAIIDRGRGPEIAGTRITVYDVLYEKNYGLSPDQIAELFQLTVAEVEAALQYIGEHQAEVQANYQRIQERIARGNPPELQARLDATTARHAPLWDERRRRFEEENGHAGNPGGH